MNTNKFSKNQSERHVGDVSRSSFSKLSSKRLIDLRKRYVALRALPRTTETRAQLRSLRDFERAICAFEKNRRVYKSQTKQRREISVVLARSQKYSEERYYDDDLVSSQSGLDNQSGLGGVAAAAAALSAASIAHTVHRSAKVAERALDNVNDVISNISGSVSSTVTAVGSSATGLLDSITAFVKNVKESFGPLWILPVAIGAYAIFWALSKIPLLMTIVLGFFKDVLCGIWNYISHFFTGTESQSGLIESTSYFATVAACLMVPNKDPKIMVGEIMRRAGSAERTTTGLTYIFSNGLKYVEKAVNALLSIFTERRVTLTDSSERLLSEWANKVDAFEMLCAKGNPSITELQAAMALLQEGIGFRALLKTTPNLTYLGKYLDRLTCSIQAHRGALNQANSFRMTPQSVMLGGGSGVGKTTVLKWLASAAMLLSDAVPAKELLNNMWQKGISEYWNGYVQQFVYIMDDCFQQKTDGRQLDNEAMFMIRAYGNWAFPLNFADLDSKGRFYFMSNMIIGSTNVADIHSHVASMVSEPSAVTRRIEHGYWISVHPDFCQEGTNRMDYKKLIAHFKEARAALGQTFTTDELLNCIPWKAWVLMPHTFDRAAPEPVLNDMTLLDLARKLAAEHKSRSASHNEEVEDLTSWANDLASSLVVPQSGVASFDLDPSARHVREGVHYSTIPQDPVHMHPLDAVYSVGSSTSYDQQIQAVRERAREDVIARREAERYRNDWIGDCLKRFGDWCDGKGLPSFFSGLVTLLRDCNSTQARKDARFIYFERNPEQAAFWVNTNRILILGAIVSVFALATKLAITVFSSIADYIGRAFGKGNIESESNVHGNTPPKRDIVLPRTRVQSQLGNPPKDVQGDLAFANTYKMYVKTGDCEPLSLGQLLFIEGDLAVMPHHFIDECLQYLGKAKETPMLRLVSCHRSEFNVEMELSQFVRLPQVKAVGADIVFLRFPRKMLKAHRSIVSMFLTEANLKQLLRNKANHVRLDIARPGKDCYDVRRHTFVSNVCEFQADGITTTQGVSYDGVVSYNAPTVAGDCGAPLSICEPRYWGGASIIGFHVAGKVGLLYRKGFASIVPRELIYSAREELGTWADNMQPDMLERGIELKEFTPEELASLQSAGLIGGSQIPIARVDKPMHIGGNTKIRPSPLQVVEPWGPSPVRPSHLRTVHKDGVTIEPMAKAMEAYQTPLEWDTHKRATGRKLSGVTMLAMKKHWEATEGYDGSIYTFEEAVSPPENVKLKPLNRRTSAGYPYRLDGGVGKTDFFGKDGEFVFDSPACEALRKDVAKIISAAENNQRSAVIFTDFPKDELRPHAKVDAVATRAISGSPLDYVIAVRQYFGAFLAATFSTHIENGMAPGVNPYTDWHVLADKLERKGGKVFAGDFSRFDASEQPDVHEEIFEYIEMWYDRASPNRTLAQRDLETTVRSILWLDLVHSRHLTGAGGVLDVLVQWNKSLPSGHPLTTLVNSMYALITLTACYVHLTRDNKDMWDHVELVTYGDDNVNAVDDTVAEVFNQVTVAEAMRDLFHLTYTSDKKGEELVKYETINDVTFLKRSFKRDPEGSGGWVAPLDKNSFLYVPYWFRNPRDVEGDLKANIEQMLGELCLYDQATWDEYYAKLVEFAHEAELTLPCQTRESTREWVFARSDAWY